MSARLPSGAALAVKVCGLRRTADAAACAAAGVSHAGLNRVDGARRRVELSAAPALLAALGPVQPVLLYRDAPLAQMLDESRALAVGWVQLHGAEPLALGRALRAAGLRLIRALPDGDAAPLIAAWLEVAEVVLLDGAAPGAGQPRAWQVPNGADPARLWLAGGLTPANVAEALERAPVAGVDAASGLERDGQLDPQKIADFVAAARQRAAQRSPG